MVPTSTYIMHVIKVEVWTSINTICLLFADKPQYDIHYYGTLTEEELIKLGENFAKFYNLPKKTITRYFHNGDILVVEYTKT